MTPLNTAMAALSTAVGYNTLEWIVQCFSSHSFVAPSKELVSQWTAVLAPIAHKLYIKYVGA